MPRGNRVGRCVTRRESRASDFDLIALNDAIAAALQMLKHGCRLRGVDAFVAFSLRADPVVHQAQADHEKDIVALIVERHGAYVRALFLMRQAWAWEAVRGRERAW